MCTHQPERHTGTKDQAYTMSAHQLAIQLNVGDVCTYFNIITACINTCTHANGSAGGYTLTLAGAC